MARGTGYGVRGKQLLLKTRCRGLSLSNRPTRSHCHTGATPLFLPLKHWQSQTARNIIPTFDKDSIPCLFLAAPPRFAFSHGGRPTTNYSAVRFSSQRPLCKVPSHSNCLKCFLCCTTLLPPTKHRRSSIHLRTLSIGITNTDVLPPPSALTKTRET